MMIITPPQLSSVAVIATILVLVQTSDAASKVNSILKSRLSTQEKSGTTKSVCFVAARPCDKPNCPWAKRYEESGCLPLDEDSDECDKCRGTGELNMNSFMEVPRWDKRGPRKPLKPIAIQGAEVDGCNGIFRQIPGKSFRTNNRGVRMGYDMIKKKYTIGMWYTASRTPRFPFKGTWTANDPKFGAAPVIVHHSEYVPRLAPSLQWVTGGFTDKDLTQNCRCLCEGKIPENTTNFDDPKSEYYTCNVCNKDIVMGEQKYLRVCDDCDWDVCETCWKNHSEFA
jgi:hypothetical protein